MVVTNQYVCSLGRQDGAKFSVGQTGPEELRFEKFFCNLVKWIQANMDLIKILRARIDTLGEGPYTEGLRSVLQHVEVASSHLRRGGEAPDDTAFTDAISVVSQR
jgi:hypothetical protein